MPEDESPKQPDPQNPPEVPQAPPANPPPVRYPAADEPLLPFIRSWPDKEDQGSKR